MNLEIKKYIDNYLEYIDKFDMLLNISKQFETDEPISELIRKGIMEFLLYLSASDGVLSQKEADTIFKYLGYRHTPDEMNRYIEEHNLYSEDFEETVPDFLQMLSAVDRAVVKEGMNDPELSRRCVEMFSAIGNKFIRSDLLENEDERRDYEIYMETLEGYLRGRVTV